METNTIKISRRKFLGTTAGAGLLGITPGWLKAQPDQNIVSQDLLTAMEKPVLKYVYTHQDM